MAEPLDNLAELDSKDAVEKWVVTGNADWFAEKLLASASATEAITAPEVSRWFVAMYLLAEKNTLVQAENKAKTWK